MSLTSCINVMAMAIRPKGMCKAMFCAACVAIMSAIQVA